MDTSASSCWPRSRFVEERRQHGRESRRCLRTRLFRIPAFTAGLGVQLAFAAGLQGFFLVFAVWIQLGMGFSPLGAGPDDGRLQRRQLRARGRGIPSPSATGGSSSAVGCCSRPGPSASWWARGRRPRDQSLARRPRARDRGRGPLAVRHPAGERRPRGGAARGRRRRGRDPRRRPAAGRRAGRRAGRDGVLLRGLESHSFTQAFKHSAPVVIGLFLAAALLSLALPRTAVTEEEVTEL